MFPLVAFRTPPLPRFRAAEVADDPVPEGVPDGVRGLRSDAAIVPADGVTQTHTVFVDAGDTALFFVLADGNVLRLELVSPTGRRIDAATPLTDPSVVHAPLLDAGPFWYTGYQIQEPETGTWTLEVTGVGTPPRVSTIRSARRLTRRSTGRTTSG